MKRTISFVSHFSETTMFLMILITTSTVLIPLILNQNQIAIAQQQKQQPTGISFEIDNMTFSHHTSSVNGIQLHYVIGGYDDPVVLLYEWSETWPEICMNGT